MASASTQRASLAGHGQGHRPGQVQQGQGTGGTDPSWNQWLWKSLPTPRGQVGPFATPSAYCVSVPSCTRMTSCCRIGFSRRPEGAGFCHGSLTHWPASPRAPHCPCLRNGPRKHGRLNVSSPQASWSTERQGTSCDSNRPTFVVGFLQGPIVCPHPWDRDTLVGHSRIALGRFERPAVGLLASGSRSSGQAQKICFTYPRRSCCRGRATSRRRILPEQ